MASLQSINCFQQRHGISKHDLQQLHRHRMVAPMSTAKSTLVQSMQRQNQPFSQRNGATYAFIKTTTHPHKHAISRFAAVPPMGEEFESNNKEYAELTKKIEAAAATAQEGLQGTSVYLVGMMGSGKSTVGKLVSQALGYCFFDTDALIEQLAGKTIPEIFAEDGEEDFRAIETQVLMELAPFKDCIISTGGGAPTKSENWGYMQGGISVWLNGSPTLLAQRVMRDGTENRPLLADTGASGNASKDENVTDNTNNNNNSHGDGGVAETDSAEYQALVAKLTNLLEDRLEQYSFADITVSLEGDNPSTADFGAPAAVVALRILEAVSERITRDAAARAERMNFEVVNEALPPTMRVVDSINPIGSSDPDPYMP